jgi:hypothetical protein
MLAAAAAAAAAAAIAAAIAGAAAEAVAIRGNANGGMVVRRAEFAVGFNVDALPAGAPGLVPFDNGLVTRCFGSSHAATALRASWQQQLQRVVADLGTQYVRFHGLLDDDMSVVIRNGLYSGAPAAAAAAAAAADGDGDGSLADIVGVAASGNGTTTDHPGKKSSHQATRSSSSHGDNHEHNPHEAAQEYNCTFVADQDFADPGGGVFNASSKEECCQLCYTASTGLPAPCIAAVWGPWDQGQCNLKLNSAQPLSKPGTGLQACVTTREPPNAIVCVLCACVCVCVCFLLSSCSTIVAVGCTQTGGCASASSWNK